jgi:hypothetical protein
MKNKNVMEIKRKTCIFCNQSGSFKSDEHVIPRWILKLLGIEKDFKGAYEVKTLEKGVEVEKTSNIEDVSFDVQLKRSMTYDGYLSGYVCDTCNHGWMCNLEATISPILGPLILGKRHPRTLKIEEKKLIARWAAKTTCVIDSVDPSEFPTPIAANPSEIRTNQELPNGWAVFAMGHKQTQPFSYICNSKWHVSKSSLIRNQDQNQLPRLRKTAIQIGNLILVSVFLGETKLRLRAIRSKHQPIGLAIPVEWIKDPLGFVIKATELPDNHSENIMREFAYSLSLRAQDSTSSKK